MKVGLCLACRITRQEKGFPFEVPIPEEDGVEGVVLADHIRSVDWRARNAKVIRRSSDSVLEECLELLETLLTGDDST